MQIMGLQEMKGTSKKTGKPYDSVVLYVSEQVDGVYGVRTSDIWVPRELWDEQVGECVGDGLLGLEVYPSYDRRGYLQQLTVK